MLGSDYWYDRCLKAEEQLMLHEQALLWAVGTGKLPPTCPGHFMHLLIEAKEKVDKLNGV